MNASAKGARLGVLTICLALGLASGLGVGLAGGPARAADPPAAAGPQPPMNDFYQAFYRCDGGGAFSITYDSDQPTTAEMVMNDGAKPYQLKRAAGAGSGFQFAGGGAKFWTDGKTVSIDGTKTAFKDCKLKGK